MDLSTTYLGLKLKNPIIVSSSTFTGDKHSILQCQDQGVGAVVLQSLFEEQLRSNRENDELIESYKQYPEAYELVEEFAEKRNPENCLKSIEEIRKDVSIPVIASFHVTSPVGWLQYAKQVEEAGADAIELNIRAIHEGTPLSGDGVEDLFVDIVRKLKEEVSIPISVKLGYRFTSLYGIARRLQDAGADGLVLFHRYFKPDIDINTLSVRFSNLLSHPDEISEATRWISLLSSDLNIDIAASTAIHHYEAAVKQILAGATAVMVTSALYRDGIHILDTMQHNMQRYMEKQGFESLDDFKGKLSGHKYFNDFFERVQYMKRASDCR